jgi:hypothetical protein
MWHARAHIELAASESSQKTPTTPIYDLMRHCIIKRACNLDVSLQLISATSRLGIPFLGSPTTARSRGATHLGTKVCRTVG